MVCRSVHEPLTASNPVIAHMPSSTKHVEGASGGPLRGRSLH